MDNNVLIAGGGGGRRHRGINGDGKSKIKINKQPLNTFWKKKILVFMSLDLPIIPLIIVDLIATLLLPWSPTITNLSLFILQNSLSVWFTGSILTHSLHEMWVFLSTSPFDFKSMLKLIVSMLTLSTQISPFF